MPKGNNNVGRLKKPLHWKGIASPPLSNETLWTGRAYHSQAELAEYSDLGSEQLQTKRCGASDRPCRRARRPRRRLRNTLLQELGVMAPRHVDRSLFLGTAACALRPITKLSPSSARALPERRVRQQALAHDADPSHVLRPRVHQAPRGQGARAAAVTHKEGGASARQPCNVSGAAVDVAVPSPWSSEESVKAIALCCSVGTAKSPTAREVDPTGRDPCMTI